VQLFVVRCETRLTGGQKLPKVQPQRRFLKVQSSLMSTQHHTLCSFSLHHCVTGRSVNEKGDMYCNLKVVQRRRCERGVKLTGLQQLAMLV
jgi:hypothetical protein